MAKTDCGVLYLHSAIRREYGVTRIVVSVLRQDPVDGKTLNCCYGDWRDEPWAAYGDLCLESYFGDDGRPYGMELGYRNVFSVDARRATLMAATLKRLEKALAAEGSREPGDMFMALARGVKASAAIGCKSDGTWGGVLTLAEGRAELRRLIAAEAETKRAA